MKKEWKHPGLQNTKHHHHPPYLPRYACPDHPSVAWSVDTQRSSRCRLNCWTPLPVKVKSKTRVRKGQHLNGSLFHKMFHKMLRSLTLKNCLYLLLFIRFVSLERLVFKEIKKRSFFSKASMACFAIAALFNSNTLRSLLPDSNARHHFWMWWQALFARKTYLKRTQQQEGTFIFFPLFESFLNNRGWLVKNELFLLKWFNMSNIMHHSQLQQKH